MQGRDSGGSVSSRRASSRRPAGQRAYVGVKSCGCVTAALVDDKDTTARQVRDFCNRMLRTKREVKLMQVDEAIDALGRKCQH